MKLEVPEVLKVRLVDEWEDVTKSSRLVPLPRTPSVQAILAEFKEWLPTVVPNSKQRTLATVLPVIVAGIQLYFDKSLGEYPGSSLLVLSLTWLLGANLLYRFERAQYADIRRRFVNGPAVMVGEPKDMSAIYGAEHLLRLIGMSTLDTRFIVRSLTQLLVNLPAMIAQTTMDAESVALLKEYVEYLLQYLVQERARLFLTEYEHASPHYQNLSRA